MKLFFSTKGILKVPTKIMIHSPRSTTKGNVSTIFLKLLDYSVSCICFLFNISP